MEKINENIIKQIIDIKINRIYKNNITYESNNLNQNKIIKIPSYFVLTAVLNNGEEIDLAIIMQLIPYFLNGHISDDSFYDYETVRFAHLVPFIINKETINCFKNLIINLKNKNFEKKLLTEIICFSEYFTNLSNYIENEISYIDKNMFGNKKIYGIYNYMLKPYSSNIQLSPSSLLSFIPLKEERNILELIRKTTGRSYLVRYENEIQNIVVTQKEIEKIKLEIIGNQKNLLKI